MPTSNTIDYLNYDEVKEELRGIVLGALAKQREEIAAFLENSNAEYQDNARHLAVKDVLKRRAAEIRARES